MDHTVFFVGLNPRWQMYRFLPDGLNVMFSAAGFWNGRGWRRARYPKNAGLKFLDPGGFTLLNKCGDYPFTVANFLNLVVYLKPNYYATPDYPCESEIARGMLRTNAERIRATVENARIVSQLHELTNYRAGSFVPVIQGYTLDEYKYCIELYADAGLLQPYMAVGSMCRRLSSAELRVLIPGITEYARQGNVERLHWFGLKLSPDLLDLREFIYSQDSAVALDSYDAELRQQRNGRRFPNGQDEKRQAFYSFLSRLDSLGLAYQDQARRPNIGWSPTALSGLPWQGSVLPARRLNPGR